MAREDKCGVRSRAEEEGQARNPTAALRTLNGVDLADGIAESVAEAGNPGYSLIHPGHGALKFGLSAEEDIGRSPSSLPSSPSRPAAPRAENTSVLYCYMTRRWAVK